MMPFGYFTWGGGFWPPPPDALRNFYATPRNQRCEPPQVLGNGGQNELILGASWTTQSRPAELQDAWFLWAALRFEWADIAVELACAIQKRLALAAPPKLIHSLQRRWDRPSIEIPRCSFVSTDRVS